MQFAQFLKSEPFYRGIAGVFAGLVSTAVVHPLDVIKVKQQVDSRKQKQSNGITILKNIVKNEGFGGLFKGLGSNLLASSLSWGLYSCAESNLKQYILSSKSFSSPFWIKRLSSGPYNRSAATRKELSTLGHIFTSTLSSVAVALVMNPIYVVKTRLTLLTKDSQSDKTSRPSTLNCMISIAKNEGVSALYSGLAPSLIISHGTIQMVLYEELKEFWGIRKRLLFKNRTDDLTSTDHFAIGGISKAAASLVTYPLMVVKSRLHTNNHSGETGIFGRIKDISRQEGIHGLYGGLSVHLLRVVPSASITMAVYEQMYGLLASTR